MKIGVVYADDKMPDCGFETTKTAEFGAVEVYRTVVCKKTGKRRFARQVKRCIKALSDIGVSICAVEGDFAHLFTGGIPIVCNGERVIRQRAGFAAQSFAEKNGICADIAICGGSFSEVLESAGQILKTRRSVYVRNPAFDDIAEAIFRDVGVSIGQYTGANLLEVNFKGDGHFLKFGEKFADFGDIAVKIPKMFSEGVPEKIIPQLAETLEISGFLRKKEIKVEYFLK